jgi:hypothetical protein
VAPSLLTKNGYGCTFIPPGKRCIKNVETKMESAQKVFDKFSALRVELESLDTRADEYPGI